MTQTAKTNIMGRALIQARQTLCILNDDVARLLKISRAELTLFENGEVEIPQHILESIFTLGLMMMHTRSILRDYNHMARQWRQMHNKALDMYRKLEKIKTVQSPVLE